MDNPYFTTPREPHQVVQEFLEARGFGWQGCGARSEIVYSRSEIGLGLSWPYLEQRLESYTFRRLLRHLTDLRAAGPFLEEELSRSSGGDETWLREQLEWLSKDRLVICHDGRWGLVPEVTAKRFGPTLEWYVAQRLITDLHWTAAWGVHLEETPYNDFDVIGVRGSEIAIVECKATEPDKVKDAQIDAFGERHRFLSPSFSLFMVDSDKPIEKLATRVNERLGRRRPVEQIEEKPQIFWASALWYIGNTKASSANGILRTIQFCVRNHFTKVHGRMVLG